MLKLYPNVLEFIKKNNLNENVRVDTAGSAELIAKNKNKK